jgi:hypothetical protein
MKPIEWAMLAGVIVLFVGGVMFQGVDLFPLPELFILLIGAAFVRWQLQTP